MPVYFLPRCNTLQNDTNVGWGSALIALYLYLFLLPMTISGLASKECPNAHCAREHRSDQPADIVSQHTATNSVDDLSGAAKAPSVLSFPFLDFINANGAFADSKVIGPQTIEHVKHIRRLFLGTDEHPELHYELVRKFLEKYIHRQARVNAFVDFYQRYDRYLVSQKGFVPANRGTTLKDEFERFKAKEVVKRAVFGDEFYNDVFLDEYKSFELGLEITLLVQDLRDHRLTSNDLKALLSRINASSAAVKNSRHVTIGLRNLDTWLSHGEYQHLRSLLDEYKK